MELQVAIWARTRDAHLTRENLTTKGFSCACCHTWEEFRTSLAGDLGAALIAGELLSEANLANLRAILNEQPPWSDLPIIIVGGSDLSAQQPEIFDILGNVSVLPRPLSLETLRSTLSAALRARRRQYQIRNLLQQKDDAERRKDEFVAMLAHELRNPLAPMRTGLRLLQLHSAGEMPSRVHAMMDRQLTNLTRLVDDLLDVSRLTRRKIALKRCALDVRESVRQAVEAVEHLARERGLMLRQQLGETPLLVEADPVRLEQMIGNVLGNALKFTPARGQIRVSAAAEPGWVVIRVRDTGVGIPPDQIGRVFELFGQTDRTLDRSQGGLGIGLTIVKLLAELHGGVAEVFSEGEGKGTEVAIRLPAAGAVHERDSADTDAFPQRVRLQRVLIIEDNPDAAEMLAIYLEQVGHEVIVANRGDVGIAMARRHRPAVVICDIGLPGANGYEVARQLRASPGLEPCVLIAMTGYGDVADHERSRRAGFTHHLTKPADPVEVAKLIAAATDALSS